MRLWNPNTSAVLHELKVPSSTVRCVAFNSDGSAVAAGNGSRVEIWNSESGRHLMTLRGHAYSVISIAFSPDGSKLASAGEDGTVRHLGYGDMARGGRYFRASSVADEFGVWS